MNTTETPKVQEEAKWVVREFKGHQYVIAAITIALSTYESRVFSANCSAAEGWPIFKLHTKFLTYNPL
jgi:hypothetical protein